MSLPYMPFFTGDYLRDTRGLTTEEHGAYLLLLFELWNRGGALPMDHDLLARITGLKPARWAKVWAALEWFFQVRTDRLGSTLEHKRITAELQKAAEKSAKRSNAGKRGAEGKWNKNNPRPMANAWQTDGKPYPEPNITNTALAERTARVGLRVVASSADRQALERYAAMEGEDVDRSADHDVD